MRWCVNANPNYGALWLHCKSSPSDSALRIFSTAVRLVREDLFEWDEDEDGGEDGGEGEGGRRGEKVKEGKVEKGEGLGDEKLRKKEDLGEEGEAKKQVGERDSSSTNSTSFGSSSAASSDPFKTSTQSKKNREFGLDFLIDDSLHVKNLYDWKFTVDRIYENMQARDVKERRNAIFL